jgi:hypothetical protein
MPTSITKSAVDRSNSSPLRDERVPHPAVFILPNQRNTGVCGPADVRPHTLQINVEIPIGREPYDSSQWLSNAQ